MRKIIKVFPIIEKGFLVTEGKYRVPIAYQNDRGQIINSHEEFLTLEDAQQAISKAECEL